MHTTTRRLPGAILALAAFGVGIDAQAKDARTIARGATGKAIVQWLEKAGGRRFSGAVLASRKGQVVAAVGVGHADLEKKTPITPATLFEIASLSKQFTAAATVRLAQQKKLALDDRIAKHLPGIPKSCEKITVRHLLQHTSGIPGTNSAGGGDDLAKVLPTFLAGGPRHEPGTHWEYWNQGYALASEIVARAAKTSFVDYCREEVFKRANLKSTCFTGDRAPRGATVAVGTSKVGPPRSALAHPYGSFGFQYRGMGGVVTNVWDLWRWDRALDGTKVLKRKGKAELFRPGPGDYALGWFVREVRGRRVQYHGGGVRGFVCIGRRYPAHDACVFVLANDDRVPVNIVADAVEQLLFGEPVTVVLPDPDDARAGAFLVGTYRNAEGSKLEIAAAGDRLRAEVRWVDGNVSRMLVARDDEGVFKVFVNTDRYDLEVAARAGDEAKTLKLWGRTFERVE